MATSTVLRVKRRLEDNPQDALVLMCKRKKTETDEISPSLFVFRGTVETQETPNVKNIVPKTDRKLQSASKVEDIIQKLRNQRKEQSTESRYEIVNFSRGLKDSETERFDLVDLQRKDEEEGHVQYAYDLYMAATQDFDVSMLDQLVSIEDYESDLVFNRNGAGSSSDEADDDDSNDENNWRNEYPDSESSSINEDAIIKAMEKVDLEDTLSSDDGEDQIYTDSLLVTDDVKRYGEAYAKYKARVLSEAPETKPGQGFVHCATIKDMDEESVDGYKDISDDEGFYYGQEEDTEQFREQYASEDEREERGGRSPVQPGLYSPD